MGKFIDITGNRYGRLTVICYDHSNKKSTFWKCKCDCGNIIVTRKSSLTGGITKSCGCLVREISQKKAKSITPEQKRKDYTGQKYNRLTFVEFVEMKGTKSMWRLKCDCGNEHVAAANLVVSGRTKSCGCLAKENGAKTMNVYHKEKHHIGNKKFTRTFRHMKDRCNNENDPSYKNYGARGIRVLWNSLEEFTNDMYESYLEHCEKYGEDNTTIDRIDVNGDYCKENCKWATWEEQRLNRTVTIYVIMSDGSLTPIAKLARELNLSLSMLRHRYYRSEYNGTHKIPYNKLIKDEDIV